MPEKEIEPPVAGAIREYAQIAKASGITAQRTEAAMGWLWTVEIIGHNGAARKIVVPYLMVANGRRIWETVKTRLIERLGTLDPDTTAAILKVDSFARACSDGQVDFHSNDREVVNSLELLAQVVSKLEDEADVRVSDLLFIK